MLYAHRVSFKLYADTLSDDKGYLLGVFVLAEVCPMLISAF